MKELITVNKVKQRHNEGCSVILVDKNTLVTMAAKDKAKELNIEFKNEKQIELCNTLKPPLENEKCEAARENVVKELVQWEKLNYTEDLIQKVLKEVLKKLSGYEKV